MNIRVSNSNEYVLNANISNGKVTSWGYNADPIPITEDSKVNVFYNYYKPKQEERHKEILYCFNSLLKNDKVDYMYVLLSDNLEIEDDKLIKIKISDQPKFKDFFNLVNFYANNDDINIILNSDCYIDEANLEFIIDTLGDKEAYLLSRWDILSLKPFKIIHFNEANKDDSGCSQDAWIFRGKPREGLNGNFEMGKAGCDNAIAYEFDKAGYSILNPSFSIKIFHYHISKIRTYGDYEVGGLDNRGKHRVPPPYKFVPSTSFITNNGDMNVVFYNHYHNGDIHYSREFVKDIKNKFKAKSYLYYFNLEHVCNEYLIQDCNIKYIDSLPESISDRDQITVIGNTIYINTWIGQRDRYYVDKYGINLKGNYQIFKEIYRKLDIKIEDPEFYIPDIDYSYFITRKIKLFMDSLNSKVKILISNGVTRSLQCNNFDLNESIEILSSYYKNVSFILTDASKRIKNPNVYYTNDIINKKCDLNEISYLSTFCDIIVGRASGPYAFSMTKENMFNPNKIFMCFAADASFEWYISNKCKHIISNKSSASEISDLISDEIDSLIGNKKNVVRRVAFTIILNGLHHLKHNDYAEFLAKNFDYWIIVEGAADNKGSTSWCREMPKNYHKNGKSIDGTVDYIKKLKRKYDNIIFVESDGVWESKDVMVNRAIEEVRKLTRSCFLWEIDIDEQWTTEQIKKSETELIEKGAKNGCFEVLQFVGDNLITEGKDWAGVPFNRLWNWRGEKFLSHEPPILDCEDKNIVLLSEKMKHYSFYFEQDVKFKNDWYTDHDGLLENWYKLKKEKKFPQHITYLFPKFKGSKYIGNSNNLDCRIVRYKGDNVENNPFNNLVDKTYVINLERRKDRLDHITEEMTKIGVAFNRFNAIDGRTLKLNYSEIRRSQIGCYRSHIGVIKDAVENNFNIIAVFEDDIIFCKDFQSRFKYYLENVPDDWDIMYLGCHFHDCQDPIPVKNNISLVKESYGCFAMVLNNKKGLFNKILDNANDIRMAYDDYIKTLQSDLRCYVFMPFFVRTLNTVSDISNSNVSFSYDIVDKYFQNEFAIPVEQRKTPVKPQPIKPQPQVVQRVPTRTQQEICEDYLRSNVPFVIYYAGRIIFDSTTSDKMNLSFWQDHFTLYGKVFPYQNMLIKAK